MTREELKRLKAIDERLQQLKKQEEMSALIEALEDLMDAADILIRPERRDHMVDFVCMDSAAHIPRTTISRLQVALEEARRAVEAWGKEKGYSYSFAGVLLEVECHLCKGVGVVLSEVWNEWTDKWLAGERSTPMPKGEEHVECPLCNGKGRAVSAEGAKLVEFMARRMQ